MRGVETYICQLHSRTASLPSMGMINALTHLNKLLHITGARESFPSQTCQQTKPLQPCVAAGRAKRLRRSSIHAKVCRM
jgi:hypothetical protein